MLPGCTVRTMSPKLSVRSGSVWPLVLTQFSAPAIHKAHSECVKTQAERTACVWLQIVTLMPDTQSACGGRNLAEIPTKKWMCVFIRPVDHSLHLQIFVCLQSKVCVSEAGWSRLRRRHLLSCYCQLAEKNSAVSANDHQHNQIPLLKSWLFKRAITHPQAQK